MTDVNLDPRPSWVNEIEAAPSFQLDADRLLASGAHPLEEVLGQLGGLRGSEGGILRASFTPGPLINLVEQQGYLVWTEHDAKKHATVFMALSDRGTQIEGPDPTKLERDPEGAIFWLENDVTHMDVRHLPPPGPMIEILKFLDSAAFDGVLVTHTPHYPMHLIPELEARKISHDIISDSDGDTLLCLTGE